MGSHNRAILEIRSMDTIMRAIYASQSQRFISILLIEYIANATEAVKSSGVPVAEQDPLFEGGEVYQGPTKEIILSDTIEKIATPKEKETTGDEQTSLIPEEGEQDATPGDTTERTGTGDTPGDGDTTGGERTDSGSDRSVPEGKRDSEDSGDAIGDEPERDGESDGGAGPRGGRTTPTESDTPGEPVGGESQTDGSGEAGDRTTPEESGKGGGSEPEGDVIDDAISRAREKRRRRKGDSQTDDTGSGDAGNQEQTGGAESQETPQTTPSEEKSQLDRVIDRVRRKRAQNLQQPTFTKTGLAQFDRISELQQLQEDQQEIVDEFIEGLVETSIEELHEDSEAEGGLDEFDTELLEALEAKKKRSHR